MTARAKCTASAKDLIKCFRSNEKRLDPESYQKAEIEVLIADKEQILADIISETPRANESTLMAALEFGLRRLPEGCHQRGGTEGLCMCAACSAEEPKQQFLQEASSGCGEVGPAAP